MLRYFALAVVSLSVCSARADREPPDIFLTNLEKQRQVIEPDFVIKGTSQPLDALVTIEAYVWVDIAWVQVAEFGGRADNGKWDVPLGLGNSNVYLLWCRAWWGKAYHDRQYRVAVK